MKLRLMVCKVTKHHQYEFFELASSNRGIHQGLQAINVRQESEIGKRIFLQLKIH